MTNLPRGISLDELTKRTGIKPQHQFTARFESNNVSCVKLSFERPRLNFHFYSVFRNGALASVQLSPRVEFVRKTNRGIRLQQPKSVHPEIQMNKVIHGRDLSAQEIAEQIDQWLRAGDARPKESPNLLPMLPLIVATELANKPSRDQAKAEAASLAEKLDPFKIKLGMTAGEVKAVFEDTEHRHVVRSNVTWHCYGSDVAPHLLPANISSVWVSVVFLDGKVSRVFSHDFYHRGPLGILGGY